MAAGDARLRWVARTFWLLSQLYFGVHYCKGWRVRTSWMDCRYSMAVPHALNGLHGVYGCSHIDCGLQGHGGWTHAFYGLQSEVGCSHTFYGLQYDIGCSHFAIGLQKCPGCRFALILWVARVSWLPVRICFLGCRQFMATGNAPPAVLVWITQMLWLRSHIIIMDCTGVVAAVAQFIGGAGALWLFARYMGVAGTLWLWSHALYGLQ